MRAETWGSVDDHLNGKVHARAKVLLIYAGEFGGMRLGAQCGMRGESSWERDLNVTPDEASLL